MDIFGASLAGVLAPPVLFFLLGAGAALVRSDLSVPDAIGKGLSLYLMLAIGFKGGVAVAATPLGWTLAGAILAGIALSFAIPFLAYGALRAASRLDAVTAASVSGHYGSVSVVTFVTATAYLASAGIPHEGFMPAVMALMETPAILSALWLARRAGAQPSRAGTGHILREVAVNGSVLLLLGSFAVGWITGERGMVQLSPFVDGLFPGLLCLFLLDMGLIAARQLRESRALSPTVIAFGFVMPVAGAACGLAAGLAAGLMPGGVALMAVLGASASYIAVPAVMRLALPQANPGVAMTLSLAITFPLNVLVGIPLCTAAALAISG